MTTTAQPVAGLEVGNTDAMDLLSDAGYDMREGDIDFDMGSTNEYQHQEDDALSLRDAGEDGGFDLQNASGNQDDFMVDNDLFEEDEEPLIDYSDLELGDAGQPSVDNHVNVQAAVTEPTSLPNAVANVDASADNDADPEEDLIDYSDDERQEEGSTLDAGSSVKEFQEGNYAATNDEDDQNFAAGAAEAKDTSTHEEHESDYEYQGEDAEAGNDSIEQRWTEGAHADWDRLAEPGNQENTYTDGDLQSEQKDSEQDEHTKETNEADDESGARPDDETQTKSQAQQESNNDSQPQLHPVTLNYDGSELWLFKPRETEDGDWLLSDESVASQHFPYLFHACRARLGDDISSETELGFRFDHFHALELYEDCTACAYATLKDFIGIYLELHAQDGHSSPEPFYITLQFRPRVLTLVNELKKAVQDQIGFSGLNTAVASGNTSFNTVFSNDHAGAFDDNWTHEEEESAEEGSFGHETSAEGVSHLGEEFAGAQPSGYFTDDAHESPAGGGKEKLIQGDIHNGEHSSKANSLHTSSRDASAPESNGGGELEDDLIDYSEDEDETNAAEAEQTPAKGPPSSSSTVHGDDTSYGHDGNEEFTNPTETREDDRHSEFGHDDSTERNLNIEGANEPEDEDPYPQYEDRNGGHDGGYGEQGFDPDYGHDLDLREYTTQDLPQGDNSYYYDGDGNVNSGQQDNLGLFGEAEDFGTPTQHDESASVAAENGFDGVEDFLDLTGNDGTESEENEINYDDEEGATKQDAVAVSSALPPAVASSTRLSDQGSPQGQKRPIDEVDGGLDGADDAIDAKRQKL